MNNTTINDYFGNGNDGAAFLLLKQLLGGGKVGNGIASWPSSQFSAPQTVWEVGKNQAAAILPPPSFDDTTTALLTQLLASLSAGDTAARHPYAQPIPPTQSLPHHHFEGQQSSLQALLRSSSQPNIDHLIRGLLINKLLSGNQYALERPMTSIGGLQYPLRSQLVPPPTPMDLTLSPPAQSMLPSLNRNHDFAEPVSNQPEKKNETNYQRGTWSEEEHGLFLKGLEEFGAGRWKEIAQMIPSRTSDQTRSHAQKYFKKLARSNKNAQGGKKREREENETTTSDEVVGQANAAATETTSKAAVAPKKIKAEEADASTTTAIPDVSNTSEGRTSP